MKEDGRCPSGGVAPGPGVAWWAGDDGRHRMGDTPMTPPLFIVVRGESAQRTATRLRAAGRHPGVALGGRIERRAGGDPLQARPRLLSSAVALGRRVEKVRHLRLGVRYGACDIAALH